jgi:hypothetical protein
VPARLQPQPFARELRFVNDHEQRGNRDINATVRWLQRGGGIVAEVDSYGGRPPLSSEFVRRGRIELPVSVRDS